MLKQLQKLARALHKFNLVVPELERIITAAKTFEDLQEGDQVKIIRGDYSGKYGEVTFVDHQKDLVGIHIPDWYLTISVPASWIDLNQSVPDKIDPHADIDAYNGMQDMAEKRPAEFLNRYWKSLDEMNDKQVHYFELALKNIIDQYQQHDHNSRNHWDNLIVPIINAYPEYISALSNNEIVSPIVIYQRNDFPNIITDEVLTNIFMRIEDYERLSYIRELFQEIKEPEKLKYYQDNFPEFLHYVYNFIVDQHPAYYFVNGLDKIFNNQEDEEMLAYKIFKADPVEFLTLGLDKKFPNFDDISFDTYPEGKSSEEVAVAQLVKPPLNWYKVDYFLRKKYYDKYPLLTQNLEYKLINSPEALYGFTEDLEGHIFRKKPTDEYILDLAEKIAWIFLNEGDYESFFKNAFDLIFKDLGNQVVKQLYKEQPETFKELNLNIKYPLLSYRVGDIVNVNNSRFGGWGKITEYDINTGDAIVQPNTSITDQPVRAKYEDLAGPYDQFPTGF